MKYILDWADEHTEFAVLIVIVAALMLAILGIFVYEMTALILSCS